VDLPFATPIVLQPNEDPDASMESRGIWLGVFAAQGGSVVRMFGNRCRPDNRNLSAGTFENVFFKFKRRSVHRVMEAL